jgi:RND superfamily putative drug exporter
VASTATRAVVFSGTAFSLALLGMFLVPDTVLRSLALGAIVVAIVSIAVALTFHPALLMVLGDRVDRLRVPWLGKRVAASAGTEGRFWGSAVRAVTRHPTVSLVAAVALLLLATAPLLGLKLGASGPSSLPNDTPAKQGLVALERDFPAGASDPVEIAVDTRGTPALDGQLERLRSRLESDPDFAADKATIERGQGLVVVSVPLNTDANSEEASAAIDRLRDDYVPQAFGAAADRVLVGGAPAEVRDYFALVGNWLPIVIAFVLALSFVLLTLAFRSIVVPLTAIAVNLLSVGAAYGLLVLVFQEGVGVDFFGFGQVERIEAWVPVFLFSVLFGLSMDYQVFLLSRFHERYRATADTTEAIIFGVGSTARLITGAALIIVVVFAGFASGKLVVPADGLWRCRGPAGRRDDRALGGHTGGDAAPRGAQLVPARLAWVAAPGRDHGPEVGLTPGEGPRRLAWGLPVVELSARALAWLASTAGRESARRPKGDFRGLEHRGPLLRELLMRGALPMHGLARPGR